MVSSFATSDAVESMYMGHANIAVTLDRYGHLMPGNEDQAAALQDTYIDGAVAAAARAASL